MSRGFLSQSAGFSLLEALVALAILALSLGVIYQTQANSIRGLANHLSSQRAMLYGQSLLAEYTGARPRGIAPGSASAGPATEGTSVEGIRWRIERTPVALPAPLPDGAPIDLVRVDVLLQWGDAPRPRRLVLTTLDRP